jgi:tetratricopeptide (TPR) repeat protein
VSLEITGSELEIQRVLDEELSVSAAVNRLVKTIEKSETSDGDRLLIWNFFFQAGFHKEALTSMCERLKDKHKIHWGLFAEILLQNKTELSSSIFEAFFKGLRRQNATEDIWAVTGWDRWDTRFSTLRRETLEAKRKAATDRKAALMEKFYFLQSQRMQEQAGRTLKRLIYLYPDDERLQEFKSTYDEEWARDIIAVRFSEAELNQREAPRETSPADLEMIAQFVRDGERFVQSHPEFAFDLAIGFYFIEAYEPALRFAKLAREEVGSDWLIAELLILLRRYVEALEHLGVLENIYVDDPETSFGVAYLRAKAMKELGQSAAAVEILRNIIQVRPNYRSAGHLILEWSAGAVAG